MSEERTLRAAVAKPETPRHKWETFRTMDGRGPLAKRCVICGLCGTLSVLKKAKEAGITCNRTKP